jgi:hypothetical protein
MMYGADNNDVCVYHILLLVVLCVYTSLSQQLLNPHRIIGT